VPNSSNRSASAGVGELESSLYGGSGLIGMLGVVPDGYFHCSQREFLKYSTAQVFNCKTSFRARQGWRMMYSATCSHLS
jgi:hypothetical protein